MRKTVLASALLVMGLMANAQAADIDSCPDVSDIKATPYTDDTIQPPHNEGFQYTANEDGHTWTGVTMSTADDYLDKKYDLKATGISADGKTCEYGGDKVTLQDPVSKEKIVSDPYLKLTRKD